MKRLLNRMDRVSEFRSLIESKFIHLNKLKKEDNRQEFDRILTKLLPRVKRYISRRLTSATINESVQPNEYEVDDFVNDLYLTAFKEIQEVKDEKYFESWLVKKVDQLINSAITENEFDKFFISNIDDYTQVEWDSMIEKFSTDGDGDFVMEEELDDISYPKHLYTLQDVFIENYDRKIIEDLSEQMLPEIVHQHIDFVSHRLPTHLRTAFTLTVCQQFTSDEVAHIKQVSVQEVVKNVNKAKELIRTSFEHRYVTKEFLN